MSDSASHGLYNRDETTQFVEVAKRAEEWFKTVCDNEWDDTDEDIEEVVVQHLKEVE